jgi:hypothetical protein
MTKKKQDTDDTQEPKTYEGDPGEQSTQFVQDHLGVESSGFGVGTSVDLPNSPADIAAAQERREAAKDD